MSYLAVKFQWEPPGKYSLVTTDKIQWQMCNCGPPLQVLMRNPKIHDGQRVVVETENSSQKY